MKTLIDKIFEISAIKTKLNELYQSDGRHLKIEPQIGEIGVEKVVPDEILLHKALNYNLKQLNQFSEVDCAGPLFCDIRICTNSNILIL